jgi:ketosteroid isomerase-like protein
VGDDADVLRQGYDSFARGDMQAATGFWDDEFRYEGPNSQGLPDSGTHEGREAAARILMGIGEHFDNPQVVPDEFVEDEGTVIVLGHFEGTARSTGNAVKAPFVHIWRMRDGRAVRLQVLYDTALVLDALGGG